MLAHVDHGAGAAGRRSFTRAVRSGVAALGAAVLLTGCGAASESSPPTGVDGLKVPTASVRPADFVSGIDNPWLAWTPGATFTYERAASDPADLVEAEPDLPGAPSDLSITVAATTTQVAGIAATTVTTSEAAATTTDWYAQDRSGNVWWLGRLGQWQVGVQGARAGLLVTARPRTGDGFRLALLGGVVEDRGLVVEASGDGTSFETQTIEVRSDLSPGSVESRTYVEGRGLVRVVRTGTSPSSGPTVLDLTQ